MHTTIEETPVMQKTRELCQTILEQPNMQSIRQRIDAFMADGAERASVIAQATMKEVRRIVGFLG